MKNHESGRDAFQFAEGSWTRNRDAEAHDSADMDLAVLEGVTAHARDFDPEI